MSVVDESIETKASMPTSLARACPVCGESRHRVLYENRMAPIDDLDFSYAVVRCEACPMVYADRALAPDAMARYYREMSKYDGVHADDAGDVHRARFAGQFVRRLVDRDAAVLDVGCATGLFLAQMAVDGHRRLAGIEPSAEACAAARRRGLDVVTGDATTDVGIDRFDVVTLLAVLEHLRDPAPIVERIAAAMRPGSLLVVEVPDAGAFGRQEALGVATEPFGEFSIEHINFFDDAALRRLARACGLTAVASETLTCTSKQFSLFVAFRKGAASEAPLDAASARESVAHYVAQSREAMRAVDRRLASTAAAKHVVVYGAGSHTARLLCRDAMSPLDVVGIVDRNPNLRGRRMHGVLIGEPSTIAAHPRVPVVVSTFRARRAIGDYASRQFANPVVPLYPDEPDQPAKESR